MTVEAGEERRSGAAAVIGPPAGFGREVNAYLNHYVTVADTKAGAVVAGSLGVLAFCLSTSEIDGRAPIIVTLGAAVLGVWGLFPRLPKGRQGVLFWEDIRNHGSADAYVDVVRRLGMVDVETAYARQNFLAAGVVHAKMRITRWALALFVLGVIAMAYTGWRR